MRTKAIIIAALSGGLILGSTSALTTHAAKSKPISDLTQMVTVAFKPTDETALSQYAYDTVTPGTANFHQYLTPAQVATKFGQPTSYVNDFENYMQKYHVKASVYPGNLAMKLKGTAGNVSQAFKIKDTGNGNLKYTLPGSLSSKVVTVVGLYDVGSTSKKTKKPAKKTTSKKPAKKTTKALTTGHAQTTKANGTLTTTSDKPNMNLAPDNFSKEYGALKFADDYHLTDLYDKGLQGAGQRIGVIAGSDLRDRDLQTYWKAAGVNDSLSRIHRIYTVDGQKASESTLNAWMTDTQMESTLDVQDEVYPKS